MESFVISLKWKRKKSVFVVLKKNLMMKRKESEETVIINKFVNDVENLTSSVL